MKPTVFEVAVYKVKEEKLQQFLQHQPVAHGIIKKFKGFKSLQSLRAIDAPDTFVDYCEWESHEDAVLANEQASKMPELQIFFELGNGLITFGHYKPLLNTQV